MITFANGGKLVQEVGELPIPESITTLYLDLETTSLDRKEKSVNPWYKCWVAGICVTWDNHPTAYYVPVNHAEGFGKNLPREAVIDWLADLIDRCEEWVNHNVKYDAHALWNDFGLDVQWVPKLIDTVTLAKLVNSDMGWQGGYGLDNLSKKWLKEDISGYEERLQPYLPDKGKNANKDYGRIPADILGEYGCQDVLSNRRLWRYVQFHMPQESYGVQECEIRLTKVLLKTERRGMRVDPTKLRIEEMLINHELISIEEQIHHRTGMHVRPHTNEDCFDLLCNKFGLPVMGYTEDGNPSFDKEAIKKYLAVPNAPRDLIRQIITYRSKHTLLKFFVEPYQYLHIDGIMHGTYNQAVRTGRMSCRQPNFQQLNKRAKKLIIPRDGMALVSFDLSQIEFRTIVHYIKNPAALEAYNRDPDTDFHSWVAEMCRIERKPAKTSNFLMGYGGGKETLIAQLSALDTIVEQVQTAVDKAIADGRLHPDKAVSVFKRMVRDRAEYVYTTYHANLPELKATSRRAAEAAARKTYVFNAAGRRRYLPENRYHIAFNSINQSLAADFIKQVTVDLDESIGDLPIYLLAQVHDDLVFEMPVEFARDHRTLEDIATIIERNRFGLRVPVRTGCEWSDKSWGDMDDHPVYIAPTHGREFTGFAHLTSVVA